MRRCRDEAMLGTAFDEVITAAREGAEWAITAIFRDLQPPLLAYLRSQEPSEAEDLASEVWQGIGAGLERFSGDEDGFRGWVFTIARRRVLDWRRRTTRRPVELGADDRLADLAASGDAESSAMADMEADEAVRRITALLPPDQAEVIVLRVVGGLDAAQVGEILGKRPGAVRALQHRALRRLAKSFSGQPITP